MMILPVVMALSATAAGANGLGDQLWRACAWRGVDGLGLLAVRLESHAPALGRERGRGVRRERAGGGARARCHAGTVGWRAVGALMAALPGPHRWHGVVPCLVARVPYRQLVLGAVGSLHGT